MINSTFFIGPEVEHTPAFSKKTLFVVGTPEIEKIKKLAKEHNVKHVFLGANLSFKIDPDNQTYWDKTATTLLDMGYWVTLNYRAEDHTSVLKMLSPGVWHSRIFVPLLGVNIPKLQTSSGNLTVKFDSAGVRSANPGVWSMHFHEITDSNRFTDWEDYNTDVEIDETVTPGPTGWAGPLEISTTPQVTTEVNSMRKHVDLESPEVFEEGFAEKNVGQLGSADPFLGSLAEIAMEKLEAGLAPEEKSALKPDTDAPTTIVVTTPAAAAEAYAEGATVDPLGEEESKKPKAKKK